jgi:hypothetical protein
VLAEIFEEACDILKISKLARKNGCEWNAYICYQVVAMAIWKYLNEPKKQSNWQPINGQNILHKLKIKKIDFVIINNNKINYDINIK